MKLIGIAGQAQMGKDTLADRLCIKLNESGGNWERAAFAAGVKKVFCETFAVDIEFVEKWKVISENPQGFDMPVRKALQFIGDGFRQIQPDIWLDLVFRNKNRSLIVSDVRYINEFTRIKKEGGLNIIIARPDKFNEDPNPSESQIKSYVKWLYNYFNCSENEQRVFNLDKIDWDALSRLLPDPPPKDIDLFDLFVCNCGDIELFYQDIDSTIHSFCENYVFDYFETLK